MNIKINQISKALTNAATHIELLSLTNEQQQLVDAVASSNTIMADAITKLMQGHTQFIKQQQLIMDIEIAKKQNYSKLQRRVTFYKNRGYNHGEAYTLAKKWINNLNK